MGWSVVYDCGTSDHTHLLFGRRFRQMPPLPKRTIAYGKCRTNYARRRKFLLTRYVCMGGQRLDMPVDLS